MHALIVDDEAPARRRLRGVLQQSSTITGIEECASGREAVAALGRCRPGILFLDIQMPDLDGFAVAAAAQEGGEPAPAVVFVTAYDQHAVRAFAIHAFDYLLKPFEDERVLETVARAARFLEYARRGAGNSWRGFGDVAVDLGTHRVT